MVNQSGNLCVQTLQATPVQLLPAKLSTGQTVYVLRSSQNIQALNIQSVIRTLMVNCSPDQVSLPENSTSNVRSFPVFLQSSLLIPTLQNHELNCYNFHGSASEEM